MVETDVYAQSNYRYTKYSAMSTFPIQANRLALHIGGGVTRTVNITEGRTGYLNTNSGPMKSVRRRRLPSRQPRIEYETGPEKPY